ncbi:MAG: penicillin-binding transpeptidase domain-containing protein [Ktedonobacterales bacterium]
MDDTPRENHKREGIVPLGGLESRPSNTPSPEISPSPPAASPIPSSASIPADQWITQDLPPSYQSRPLSNYAELTEEAGPSKPRRWMIALGILLVVAVIGAGIFSVLRMSSGNKTSGQLNCGTGTPCQVANAYLTAYSAGNYEAVYALTSAASRKRFSDPAILRSNYKDAHDYMVNRTQAIIDQADVITIGVTPGNVVQGNSPTTASLPVRVVMTSTRVGDITQDITIPLVDENNVWRVDWSPGLIFSKLDDPASDPQYHHVVRLYTQDAARGTVFDRDGNALAKDDTVFIIGVVPSQIANESALLSTLSAKLDLTPDQIKAKYHGAPATSFVALRTITLQLYTQISGALNGLAGVQVRQSISRVYPYGTDAAAVTGYVQLVSADDLKNDAEHYYQQGDVIGRAGVEAWGEQYLRPTKGGKLAIVELNADGTDGQTVYSIGERAAVPGDDIHTTISLADQRAAMNQMRQFPTHGSGSMSVAPTTGEVLEMASFPIYDPNDFSLGFTPNGLARFNGLDHPYLNRAVSGAYPVGSVFKVITLSAGLENGVSPLDIFTCKGTYQVPGENHIRNDDKVDGHGNLTALQALPPSCDVVFWRIAIQVNSKDPNILPNVAKAFGFGAPTGVVGVPDGVENPGLVPDPQYLQQHENAQWTPTDAANLAIGQGFFKATPAQVAMLGAEVGNGGKRVQPRLINTIVDPEGKTVKEFTAPSPVSIPLSPDHLSMVQMAMNESTSQPNGTSYNKFKDFPIRVAGKTGTSESGNGQSPHSWFTCYAPFAPLSGPPTPPTIAIGAVVEYSGGGESFAVPIVKAVLKAQFKV